MSVEDDVLRYPFDPPASRALTAPAEYRKLRADQPVQRIELMNGRPAWLVSRYTDVRFLMSDPRFSNAKVPESEVLRDTPWSGSGGSLLASDPPNHTRLRKLVAGAFSKRAIEHWRPRVERLAGELIDRLRVQGEPADLVEAFTRPLSLTVICELLGVPGADRQVFTAMGSLLLGVTTEGNMAEAAARVTAYLAELVAAHRQRPRDDLLSELIAARDENEDRLTEMELVALGTTILVAGHVPSLVAISDFVYTLLVTGRWPGMALHPGLPDSAVDELFRYVSVGDIVTPRVANEDVEIAGQLIRAGEVVFPSLVSANEDEQVYDHADRLDLARTPNPHMAFGHGMHYCLGSQLARLEAQVALTCLLREFPNLRLAVDPDEVPMRVGTPARGPEALLVRW